MRTTSTRAAKASEITHGWVVIDAEGVVRFSDVMLRAFRPTDDEVLAEIHLARYDRLTTK